MLPLTNLDVQNVKNAILGHSGGNLLSLQHSIVFFMIFLEIFTLKVKFSSAKRFFVQSRLARIFFGYFG